MRTKLAPWWFSPALMAAAMTMGLIVLSGSYGQAQDARMEEAMGIYLGLGLLHLIFYGTRPLLCRWLPAPVYLAAQAAIVVALGVVSGDLRSLFGLVVILTIEAVVISVDRWRPAFVILAGVGLFIVTLLAVSGWSEAPSAAIVLVTVGLFVMIANHARKVVAEHRLAALRAEVEATHRQLGRYAAQIESLTRDQERQRLARDLHDTLAQGLAGLTLQLEAADSQLARDGVQQARDIIRRAMDHSRASLRGARQAIDDLRSPRQTFEKALEGEVARFRETAGFRCRVHYDVRGEPPATVQPEALMIVREALMNVARHARAEHVTLALRMEPNRVKIRIEDDGLGFDLDKVAEDSGHYGILGIRERVTRLGGEVCFKSRQPMGTQVLVTIPTHGA